MEDNLETSQTQTESQETVKEEAKEEPTALVEETKEETVQEEVKEEAPIDLENPKAALEEKGFNYEELQEEYFKYGDLTSETRERLAKIGITDKFIDDFINGKKAQAEAERNEWAQTIGGRETFDKVLEWAGKNCTKEEIAAINSIHDSNAIKLVLKGLKASMDEKEGILPKYVTGTAHTEADIFESQAQMFEAIKDKRYNTDSAYREKVTAKIRASRKAGINLGI